MSVIHFAGGWGISIPITFFGKVPMVITRARKAMLAVLASVVAATVATLGVAHADESGTAANDEIPHAVEDFNYPGAAKIQAETGAVLKRGDGHLLMTSCAGDYDIWIMSRTGQYDFCFDVTAKPAYLTLELPKAYGIWTSADPVKTTLKEPDGTTTVIDAPPNDFTGYGESGEIDGDPTVLIELRVTG